MQHKRNANLKHNSQQLRKNMTEEERKLWYCFLKKLPINFYRQKIICNYIVDFCCPAAKIIIELDGSQHYDDEHSQKDFVRDGVLQSLGYTVLRYTNRQLNENFDNVCKDIYRYLT